MKDLRIAAIRTVGFAGFFRFNELANIQPNHLTIYDDFVKTFVPKSKTDVYREGDCVYIAKLRGNYCPVSILRRYIQAANLDLSSHLPLFRQLTKKKSGYVLKNNRLSYSRCREVFKAALKESGCNPKDYGLHSLQVGGATSIVTADTSMTENDRMTEKTSLEAVSACTSRRTFRVSDWPKWNRKKWNPFGFN